MQLNCLKECHPDSSSSCEYTCTINTLWRHVHTAQARAYLVDTNQDQVWLIQHTGDNFLDKPDHF